MTTQPHPLYSDFLEHAHNHCQYCGAETVRGRHTCADCAASWDSRRCRCANNGDYCDYCAQWIHERIHERCHIPTLASVCDYMLLRTKKALLDHDLEEAIFWNTGYLVAKMAERIEFDLSCFENRKTAKQVT